MAKAPRSTDPLDILAEGDPKRVIQLMLWKGRMANPDMLIKITPEDIKALDDCTNYLGVQPEAKIWRPQGRPAHDGAPARHGGQAIAPFPGDPPRNYVAVALVSAGTEDVFRPIENNEVDYDQADRLAKLKRMRENVPQLTATILAMAARQDFSNELITELCETARALAKA